MRVLVMMDGVRITGPAKQLFALVKPLAAQGVAMEFVLAQRGSRPTPFADALHAGNHVVHTIVDQFAFDPRLFTQFRRVVRQVKPDLLQTHGYRPNVLARLLGPRRSPWVAFFHGDTWENAKVQIYHRLDRWAMSAADRVATVSQFQADLLTRELRRPDPIAVLPNAVLLQPVHYTATERLERRQRLGVGPDACLIGCVGRFSPEKGQDVLLDTLTQVRSLGHPAEVLLLGEGPTEARLHEQVARARLAEAVHFAGYQPNPERFYPLMDILALPSRSEGLPNVVLEAMTAGVPVVATRVGGVPEVIDNHKTGLIVPANDRAALAAALVTLIADPVRRQQLARSAAIQVRQRFSLSSRAADHLRLYRAVLSGGRA